MIKRLLHSMSRQDRILNTLSKELKAENIELYNDSYKHAHHAPMKGLEDKNETHFRLDIVSPRFTGLTRVARHRLVYASLKDEFESGLHALQITSAKTLQELEKQR
ncbi:BolA domain UV induced protein Uvi31 [Schizosaccharomyces cryophilus OY26]|uniref:BolA domain UV induced protein Uvi31 n=1 Tax=Schizosaccharomyces cryophilus (strain OY26 / ATCC MYA-4695 / CBS 11777 / NBRC 106824 / NRRL Y48691) TaxID=653667 RepID=S9XAL9_SCHCR|nr:BolA domain UV induced protein Uvi31 [Schizosaccharomyces cryophilus OY26]EPY54197.1 BolA domain UV induced protein Uvi31 [Schizosaccharomyces cryophilus OY26]